MNRALKSIHSAIDRFVSERRTSSGGGWANVEESDFEQLRGIIEKLVKAKCESDADGDYPIECILTNRRTHESSHFFQMPYSHNVNHPDELECGLSAACANISIAHSQLDRIMMLRRFLQDNVARQKNPKMADNVPF